MEEVKSEVVLVDRNLKCCKESVEIFEELAGIVYDVRCGKPVNEIVVARMGTLVNSINGFDKLPVEVKSGNFIDTAGYGGIKITRAFLDPIPTPAV